LRILVLNSGSSSIKYQLFEMRDHSVLAKGAAERIGETGSRLVHRELDGAEQIDSDTPMSDHGMAIDRIVTVLSESGVLSDDEGLAGIGHRVVHGGETFFEPTRIDDDVLSVIRNLSSLAPLHNPANLVGIEVARERRPDLPQVAVFDTAFHRTIPPHAYHYAIPREWYEKHGVRRYGFHGTSHAYVARKAAAFLGRSPEDLNLIVLHLGNGASACAIAGGRSIDTSMGLTPLEGLVMGTRSGDLDPALIFHVARQSGASLDEIDSALSSQSGLEGLCGSADLRDVLARERDGDEDAATAVEVYLYRIRKYIGAYTAALGRVDALAFTAGVGENSAEIRERVCRGLASLGIEVDPERNNAHGQGPRAIHVEGSRVDVLVVPTNEELEIAMQTLQCIQEDTRVPHPPR
jgi:acetate kinase